MHPVNINAYKHQSPPAGLNHKPDPSPVFRTIVLLAIVAGCVWGGMPEALVALLLRYLP